MARPSRGERRAPLPAELGAADGPDGSVPRSGGRDFWGRSVLSPYQPHERASSARGSGALRAAPRAACAHKCDTRRRGEVAPRVRGPRTRRAATATPASPTQPCYGIVEKCDAVGDEREIDHSRIRKHEPREYVLPRMDRISVISSVVPPVHRNLSVVRQHGRRGVHRLHQSLRGSQKPRSRRVDCNRVVRNFDPKLVVQTVLLVKPAGPAGARRPMHSEHDFFASTMGTRRGSARAPLRPRRPPLAWERAGAMPPRRTQRLFRVCYVEMSGRGHRACV